MKILFLIIVFGGLFLSLVLRSVEPKIAFGAYIVFIVVGYLGLKLLGNDDK
jgi:protein-S-isoprenylcysteine O-methyltransferase Ste14